nr:PREDICTED: mitogen-activated protein kinase kinase kinase YODA-like [Musa acuminata subsp. malaccensis]
MGVAGWGNTAVDDAGGRQGERPRPESDVWSLGCTIIEMATGVQQPWPDWRPEDAAEAMFRIGCGNELSEFPPLLLEVARDFLDECLGRDASERWTAEQLLQHLFQDEAETPMVETPMLEWANLEFHDSADDGESCSVSHSDLSDSTELVASGRERLGELASCMQGSFGLGKEA